MNITPQFNKHKGTTPYAKLGYAVLLTSFLFGCASNPKTYVNKTEEIKDCVHKITETKKISTGKKIEGEDGEKIDEEKILSHVEEAKWVQGCADYDLLVTLAKADLDVARSRNAPIEDPTIITAVLLALASYNADIELFTNRALEEQKLSKEILQDSLIEYYKHQAKLYIASAISNLKNSDGSPNYAEHTFLIQLYDGEKNKPGAVFEHLSLKYLQQEIDQTLEQQTSPLSIENIRQTLEASKTVRCETPQRAVKGGRSYIIHKCDKKSETRGFQEPPRTHFAPGFHIV